jgi:hypothetical protein
VRGEVEKGTEEDEEEHWAQKGVQRNALTYRYAKRER